MNNPLNDGFRNHGFPRRVSLFFFLYNVSNKTGSNMKPFAIAIDMDPTKPLANASLCLTFETCNASTSFSNCCARPTSPAECLRRA